LKNVNFNYIFKQDKIFFDEFFKELSQYGITLENFIQLFRENGIITTEIMDQIIQPICSDAAVEDLEVIFSKNSRNILENYLIKDRSHQLCINDWPKLKYLAQFLTSKNRQKFLLECVDYNVFLESEYDENILHFFEMLSFNNIFDEFLQKYLANEKVIDELGYDFIERICYKYSTGILEFIMQNDSKKLFKNYLMYKPMFYELPTLNFLIESLDESESKNFLLQGFDYNKFIYQKSDAILPFFKILLQKEIFNKFLRKHFKSEKTKNDLISMIFNSHSEEVLELVLSNDSSNIFKNHLIQKTTPIDRFEWPLVNNFIQSLNSNEREKFLIENFSIDKFIKRNDDVLEFVKLLSQYEIFHKFLEKFFKNQNEIRIGFIQKICNTNSTKALEFMFENDSENLFKKSLIKTTLPKVKVGNWQTLQYLAKVFNSDEREKFLFQRLDYDDFLMYISDQTIIDFFKMLSNHKIFSKFLQKVLKNENASEETENDFIQIICNGNSAKVIEFIFEKDSKNLFKNCLIKKNSQNLKRSYPSAKYLNSNEFDQFIFERVD
jgi:hypothetical protein